MNINDTAQLWMWVIQKNVEKIKWQLTRVIVRWGWCLIQWVSIKVIVPCRGISIAWIPGSWLPWCTWAIMWWCHAPIMRCSWSSCNNTYTGNPRIEFAFHGKHLAILIFLQRTATFSYYKLLKYFLWTLSNVYVLKCKNRQWTISNPNNDSSLLLGKSEISLQIAVFLHTEYVFHLL
jgi:hypothetical protein